MKNKTIKIIIMVVVGLIAAKAGWYAAENREAISFTTWIIIFIIFCILMFIADILIVIGNKHQLKKKNK